MSVHAPGAGRQARPGRKKIWDRWAPPRPAGLGPPPRAMPAPASGPASPVARAEAIPMTAAEHDDAVEAIAALISRTWDDGAEAA